MRNLFLVVDYSWSIFKSIVWYSVLLSILMVFAVLLGGFDAGLLSGIGAFVGIMIVIAIPTSLIWGAFAVHLKCNPNMHRSFFGFIWSFIESVDQNTMSV